MANILSLISISGVLVNFIDIAPNFCGVMSGTSLTLSSVAMFTQPLVSGYLTNDNPTKLQYRKLFFLSTGIATLCSVLYFFLASGEREEWDIGGNGDGENTDTDSLLSNDSDL